MAPTDANSNDCFGEERLRRRAFPHDDERQDHGWQRKKKNGEHAEGNGSALEVRNATLGSIVAKASPGIRFNEHIEGDGETVFRHACKLGLEGIVSKRKNSPYRSGRSPDWLKMKNLDTPAVKRQEEEDWGKGR